jgi:hypothetical protein
MSDSSPETPEATSEKSALSRRSFVTKASLGVVGAGALVAAGPLAGRADAAEKATPAARNLPAPLVAHVTDLKSGKVELLMGERGITVTDHALAQHLARAANH